MSTLSVNDAIGKAHNAGFSGASLATIVAIAMAESGLRSDATNTAGNSPPSTDRGIVQINSYWHPEVNDACAFNPDCAFKEAYRISQQGKNFGAWSTYSNKAYLKQMPTVKAAVDENNTNASAPWWQQLIQALAPFSSLSPSVQDQAAQGAKDAGAAAAGNIVTQAFQPLFSALPGFGIKVGLFMAALMLVIIGLWALTRNPASDTGSAVTTGLNNAATGIGRKIGRRKK